MIETLIIFITSVVYLFIGSLTGLVLSRYNILLTTLFWPIIWIFVVFRTIWMHSDELAEELKDFVEDLKG